MGKQCKRSTAFAGRAVGIKEDKDIVLRIRMDSSSKDDAAVAGAKEIINKGAAQARRAAVCKKRKQLKKLGWGGAAVEQGIEQYKKDYDAGQRWGCKRAYNYVRI